MNRRKIRHWGCAALLVLTPAAGLAASAPAPSAAAATCNSAADGNWTSNCTISEGNDSLYTVAVQWIVSSACGGGGLTVDGSFGSNTEHAVTCWQHQHGLDPDGIVGPDTWTKLRASLKADYTAGNWRYFNTTSGLDDIFREWLPTGRWYVLYAAKYPRMSLSAP